MKTMEQPVNFLRKLVPQLGLPVSTAPEIEAALAANAVCAVSISGGKDSVAAAIATWKHLDLIGHTGPRVLIHADLGVVEWKDSLPCCERLAAYLGAELLVVRRKAGDMMDRWEGRWTNNVIRYNDLSCVKLILPWSTPSMRFCTSELKSCVLASALKKRFPSQDIVSISGVRRQESSSRAKMPTWAVDSRLTRKNLLGLTWNVIIDWDIEQVFQTIADAGLALHEAYTTYGASRVSCAFCIMSAARDLVAAASCPDNHDIYRRMVELEITSTFAFQGGKWLGDSAPHLLSADTLERLATAKVNAAKRQVVEAELPKHLLFVKGWPVGMPTTDEADLIASVRSRVSTLVGLNAKILTGDEVLARYDELLLAKAFKDERTIKESPLEVDDEMEPALT